MKLPSPNGKKDNQDLASIWLGGITKRHSSNPPLARRVGKARHYPSSYRSEATAAKPVTHQRCNGYTVHQTPALRDQVGVSLGAHGKGEVRQGTSPGQGCKPPRRPDNLARAIR
eukprot:1143561-Pelagomonas_calceolata.AAC.2